MTRLKLICVQGYMYAYFNVFCFVLTLHGFMLFVLLLHVCIICLCVWFVDSFCEADIVPAVQQYAQVQPKTGMLHLPQTLTLKYL